MKKTIAKTTILNLIETTKEALSHSEIQLQVKDICDRVTIYRVLDRLVTEQKIHKIVNVDGVIKYAACHSCTSQKHQHNHIHFSCEVCKQVTCLDNVVPHFHLPQNYVAHNLNFMVSGVCPNCIKES